MRAAAVFIYLTIAAAAARQDPAVPPASLPATPPAESEWTSRPQAGGVVAVGGGALPDKIYRRILEMSGRREPKVLILPLATSEPDTAGSKTQIRFRECGAKNVDWIYFHRDDAEKSELLERIRDANIVYFPGGDQKKILEALRGTPAERAVRDVLAKGGVVGGTSAGCEVLGDLALTGKSRLDLAVLGTSDVERGLELVPGVLFDQHFLRRGRFLRLVSATIDAKRKIGIGVDESTAAFFPHGMRTLEVVGDRQITIIRRGDDTKIAPGAAGDFGRASNIKLHILADGDRYVLDQDRVIFNDRPLVAPPQTREQADDELAASRAAK